MPKLFSAGQTNFTAGELSPRLFAREDIDKYSNGLEECTNFLCLVHGPLTRRHGTQFVAEVKDSTTTPRLIPFKGTTSFILELGDQYIRFYSQSGQVFSGGSPYEISTPWAIADIDDLSYTQFGQKIYFAHGDYAPRVLERTGTTNWSLTEIDLSPPPTFEFGELGDTSLTLSAATGLGITATAGSSYFFSGDVGRQIINLRGPGRASITATGGSPSSTTATVDIVEDFPSTSISANDWKLDLSPIVDLTPSGSAAGSIISLTADDPGTTTAIATFWSGYVGRYILIHGGVVEITEYVSNSEVKGFVHKSLTSENETGNWTVEEPTWGANPDPNGVARGYPKTVGLYEQRLVFGGTDAQPQTVWLSETGIFEGFGIGDTDDDSIELDLVSSSSSEIRWLAAGRELIIGTSSSEVTLTGGNSPITPSNFQARPRTYHGSKLQVPLLIGEQVIFKQLSDTKIRSFFFDFNVDGFRAEDLTLLSEHMTKVGVKQLSYAEDPDNLIYAVLNDGTMAVGTYVREQRVIAWAHFETSGSYKSVAVIPEETESQTWVIVERAVNGVNRKYVEFLDTSENDDILAGYSDSFLVYDSVPTTTISGLDHLEGRTVAVRADGGAHPDVVVSGGSVTLNYAVEKAVIGLAYTGTVKPLKRAISSGAGTFFGQQQRWIRPIFRFTQSIFPKLNGKAPPIRDGNDPMDTAVPLFTGDKEYPGTPWDDGGQFVITAPDPFPVEINGVFGSFEGNQK